MNDFTGFLNMYHVVSNSCDPHIVLELIEYNADSRLEEDRSLIVERLCSVTINVMDKKHMEYKVDACNADLATMPIDEAFNRAQGFCMHMFLEYSAFY